VNLFEFNNRLQRFDVNKAIEEIIDKNEQAILDLNRKDQLFEKGENREGRVIGYYKPLTEILSGGKKKAGDPFTFYDTGSLYSKFQLNYKNGTLDFFSTDSKVPLLEKKYGNLFGTNPKNTIKVVEVYINPNLLQLFKREVL